MASKRKSTTPCMIPSKVIRPVEEADRDSPGPLRQSGVSRLTPPPDPPESSTLEAGDAASDGAGTYTCKPCDYETRDLNLFLDHVYSGHPDFRADPGFFCVSCGVSAPKFEGLALHNARVHPSTLNTSLRLRRRDRRAVVEQTLLSGPDGEISITKTPIMRMLKGKSESKRIAVSHLASDSVSASRETERKEAPAPAVTVTHVPTIVHNGSAKVTLPSAIQIVNGSGALPMLKTPITQVVSVVQNRSHHQSAPITASNISSASYSTSKNLPKVMIPLSSIPTYSASMDSSPFLKTSFSKFPYPTKAELCYLTVVTKFPEEQIKIWFTAQRLKQGISWSPEEIEEARRKMFNTIIQTGPSSSHGHAHRHHGPAQHTITVLPASLGAAGIPHILQGSLVSQGGVIVTANGIQVSGAPMALAVTPKPQAAARPTMHARPAATAPAADKGVGVVVGTVSSVIGGGGSQSGRAGSIITSGHASVINLSLGNAKVTNGKHGAAAANADCNNKSDGGGGHANAKTADVRRASGGVIILKGDHKGAAEGKDAADGGDGQRRKDGGGVLRKSASGANAEDVEPDTGDSPTLAMEEASSPASKSSPASPAAAAPPGATSGSQTPINAFLDPSFYKGKKSQEQLNALKDSFLRGQFPDQDEVDRLIALTGLTVREVRKWFSDRRYHFRNLKGVRSGVQGKSGSVGGGGGGADPSESGGNAGAKTPQQQHGSAPLSPTPSQTPTSPSTPSRRLPRPPSPDFTAIRYKEREPHQVKALEASFLQDPDPAGEEVDRLRSETKMTRREIHGWFADRRKRVAAEKKKEEAQQQRAMRAEEAAAAAAAAADGEERQKEDGSGELKVNPIKINLKMLKVTEANGEASDTPASPGGTPSSASKAAPPPPPPPPRSSTPKPAAVRGKKTAEQLQALKQVYARTQWPSAAQYDDMLSNTGLARPEVVRWFGDCRYVQKNGQLKWLEAYQTSALEEDLQKGNAGEVLQAHYDAHGSPEESQLQDLAQSCGSTADLVRHWFSIKGSPPRLEPTTTTTTTTTTTAAAAHEKEPRPVAPSAGGGAEEEEEKKEAAAGEEKVEKAGEEKVEKEKKKEAAGEEKVEKEEEKKKEEKKKEACGVATEAETVNPTEGTD